MASHSFRTAGSYGPGPSRIVGRPGRQAVDAPLAVRHPVRMNVRTNLLLPKDLVDEVDRFAGQRGRSRYVAEALRAKPSATDSAR